MQRSDVAPLNDDPVEREVRNQVRKLIQVQRRLDTEAVLRDFPFNRKQILIMQNLVEDQIDPDTEEKRARLVRHLLVPGPNQVGGKTTGALAGFAIHATGRYDVISPWHGPRFDRPPAMALFAKTLRNIRDKLTDRLFGPYGNRGTGFIPGDCFDEDCLEYMGGSVPHAIDTARVKWHDPSGVHSGWTKIYMFSYDAGRLAMEGYPLNFLLPDEGTGSEEYLGELVARTMKTKGYLVMPMNPRREAIVDYTWFEKRIEEGDPTKAILDYQIRDCEHLTREEQDEIIAMWKGHPEYLPRVMGRPIRGEGTLLNVPDEKITIDPQVFPVECKQGIGIDIPHSSGHFAAARGILFPPDTLVLTDVYRDQGKEIAVYASRVSALGGRYAPVFWPHDAARSATGPGTTRWVDLLKKTYQLRMHSEPSHYLVGGKKDMATWSMVLDLIDRMQTGRFKVFRTCTEFFEEKASYSQKDGQIIRKGDDVIAALLKLVAMVRCMKSPPGTDNRGRRRAPRQRGAVSGEYNFFGG